ncbi:MAG: class I SAM-dependent methyltransferase [Alphaproteobacteria bacterium]|jgi:SAM-dependent methyltransferase|nr:class I SAM-dependent methyltransferase [Alphaproteobacteria bacterium]
MQTEDYQRNIRDFYEPLLAEHGDGSAAVGYPEAAGQQGRYVMLCEVGDLKNASILDIGCGLGHLLDFLKENGFEGDYLGIDLQEEMVERSRKRHPDARFEVADFLMESPDFEGRDFILASGVLQHCEKALRERIIARMYEKCGTAAAFNAFSTWYGKHPDPRFHIADPLEVLNFCRGMTTRLLFRHEYVAHDFSVYMYRP